jgi:tetratricopeptide (TPR) repeat protein
MMTRAMSPVLTCLAWIGLSVTCDATTTESLLDRGIRETRQAEFEKAIETLEQAVAQLETRQDCANDLARAYIYLSIAHIELAHESIAKAQFLAALAIDRDIERSEVEYPPRILRFFNRIRKEIGAPRVSARSAPQDSPALTTSEIVRRSLPSTVSIRCGDSLGSGFFLSD